MAKKLTDYNLEHLYEWIEEGQHGNVPETFVQYVNLLDKIRGMMLRHDIYGSKEAIIKHLITFEPDLKGNRLKANQFYNETVEYFYADTEISKGAWRNLYADDLDKAYNLALALAENTGDIEKATKIKERAAKMRGLDKEDPVQFPDEALQKPFKIYTMEMDKHFELPNEDRKAIELWIDENTKDLPAKAIERIKQEAQILPVKIFQDEEDPRKD
ncbi:hypothetical protein [Bergeyella zoohelcum]|uniref:Uncharacterized protein n=1 Tax=Bergeyella zoohelcum TaxID=1015 RepID=A0A380ZUA9_9FLAO|nr:hypothetical protein [Bergeyella zoohelcum]EKB61402.1 hypothetical protein HMPREF9700_00897 [Bergeyella zoohelcum CCUG 30536]SSZ46506.1 Uncharacterised protein [Bergeyella zoohelcum]SUV52585.1 Uncharacterised protein [Bergeyella zoohelcum]